MDLREYQKKAARTVNSDLNSLTIKEIQLSNFVLGLIGEVGEFFEEETKPNPDKNKVQKEFGDICWYYAAINTVLGLPLENIWCPIVNKESKTWIVVSKLAELTKKSVYHQKGINLEEYSELLIEFASCLNKISVYHKISIESCLKNNIKKLEERHPNGFHTDYNSQEDENQINR